MIIQSLLDTDLYKFTMMQLAWHRYRDLPVKYGFKCRTLDIDLTPFANEIHLEIQKLATLIITPDELNYLETLGYFKPDFLEFLKTFRLDPALVKIETQDGFDVLIEGSWVNTILFEVPILAIISEIYSKHLAGPQSLTEGLVKLRNKIELVKNQALSSEFKIVEFGTRRRFSYDWQDKVIGLLRQELPNNLNGTSNILLAKKYNITPVGTMAHEYIQAFQAIHDNILDSEKVAFETWLTEYGDELGIALSDTYNMKVFFYHFDKNLSERYAGVRQDSGDPFVFGEELIKHYQHYGINPLQKKIVFSDSLTMQLAIDIFHHFQNRIEPIFGIGTHLTNDLNFSPIQIVIKMIECNHRPVAKISDSETKTVCRDIKYLTHLKELFNPNNF